MQNVDTPIVTEGVIFDGDCSWSGKPKRGHVTESSAKKAVVAKTTKLQADFEK
jgi:hypothetical protein